MSELEQIEASVKEVRTRRQWQRTWLGVWRGLWIGSLIWLSALLLYKLAPIHISVLFWAALPALIAPMIGGIFPWFRRSNLLETARWVDEHQGLKERLSTAMELAGGKMNDSWSSLVLQDATTQLSRIQWKSLVAFRVPRLGRWVLVTLALGAGLGFVPEYRSAKRLAAEEEAQNIRETGEYLEAFTRRQLEQRPPVLEQTRNVMEEVEDLGRELTRAQLTRDEALAELASALDRVKKQLSEFDNDEGLKRMKQAAQTPSSGATTAEGLQQRMEALRREMGQPGLDAERMEALQQKMDQLSAAAAEMQSQGGQLDPTMAQQMSEALSQLSQEAAEMGLNLPDLEAALDALKGGQLDNFMEAMEAATQDLEKMLEMARALQQMQMQMEQLGKNLAEQLENGEVQAAATTLEKMAKQVGSSNRDTTREEAILKELMEALDPAAFYGEAGDLMKQAAQQMQTGEREAAAETMQAAAKALRDLMNQLADLQSLGDQLRALQAAQMCVGNGMGWGQCMGNRPGAGKSGSMSPVGVGTWANDDGTWRWIDYSQLQRADNSQVQRPDMEGKGITDRGQGELPPGMLPDRVKGKFNPGGPMPSISLKGLSIKGTSQVEYTETAAAAQRDVRSALNQDQVPKAYRGAVRDYFDDIPLSQ